MKHLGTAVRIVAGLEFRQGSIPGMGRDFYLRDYLWGPTGFFSSGYCVLFNKESGWVVTLAAALCLVPSTGQCVWSYETYLYHTAL